MKSALLLASVLALGACTTLPGGGPAIDTRYTADGQNSRVQFIVVHYTVLDFPAALERLTHGQVSSHYLVDKQPPTIYRLVDENRRAWHAGSASWQGYTYLNANSIGIEIVNAGYLKGPEGPYEPYPEDQVQAVIALVRDIQQRHEVRPDRIVGHAEVLPQDKEDPGPLFPWHRLYEAGLVPWPDMDAVAQARPGYEATLPAVAWFQDRLVRHGFALAQTGVLDLPTRNVLRNFQMRYRPTRYDGVPDAETAALLDVLVRPDGLRMRGADGRALPWRP